MWRAVSNEFAQSMITKFLTIFSALVFAFPVQSATSDGRLPVGSAPIPLDFPHFPSPLHTFVFRNWNLVAPERLAKVVGTTPGKIVDLAESMGLHTHPAPKDFIKHGYITLLRRNWHLLPYLQLMQLIDMTEAELGYALLEDDFLFIKFGQLKPKCEPLRWSDPTENQRKRATAIRDVLRRHFGSDLEKAGEPRFAFAETLSNVQETVETKRREVTDDLFQVRFIYSYFGLFGDPLMDGDLASFPEGLLQRLSQKGVNGIWIHIILRNLVPGGKDFPEFGTGQKTRLSNLRRLVVRAKKYGIGVYLYLNEPRAMPHAFFRNHPEKAGVREAQVTALCTSVPEVQAWLESALTEVFREVPGLAGVFSISGSENLTNCASHGKQKSCSRCGKREYDEIIAEVNTLIERGVHAGNPEAKVIVWDWGWHGHRDASGIINKLPAGVWLMSVSEWALPIERGGVATTVGEYSLSAVGPGPRATRHWRLAKQRGLKTVAKVQFNATWELSTIPYIPVLDLIAEHCDGLATSGVDGMMLSWTVGGFPSPNLEVAKRFSVKPKPTREEVLNDIARNRFGIEGALHARAAWKAFSAAFREYPYHSSVVYNAPVQIGPANLLYEAPTGYRATMTGIPYDHLRGWRGPYPPEVFAEQFDKVARGWEMGIKKLEDAVSFAPSASQKDVQAELLFARAAYEIFRSVRNQAQYILWRDEDSQRTEEIRDLLGDEVEAAKSLYRLAKEDSRIGFEAANQYFFVPEDLLEKVVNCEFLLERLGD